MYRLASWLGPARPGQDANMDLPLIDQAPLRV